MSAFEELGVQSDLANALSDLGWSLPTPVQHETIPLTLTGSDVLASAETGSGKTGAFALPVIQIVNELISEELQNSSEVVPMMSKVDCNSGFEVEKEEGVCRSSDPSEWTGGRATVGVRQGKYQFEVEVRAEGLARVGFATAGGSLQLGTDAGGFGYGGTAKKSHKKNFEEYGEKFGKGDKITCLVDRPRGRIGFAKNGKALGDALAIPESLKSKILFPAVCLKGSEVGVSLTSSMKHQFKEFKAVGDPFESTHPNGEVTSSDAARTPRVIILEPSRDLAEQTDSFLSHLCSLLCEPRPRTLLAIGGGHSSGGKATAERELQSGVDIVTGTPARIKSLAESGDLDVRKVRLLVLDEADQLLSGRNQKGGDTNSNAINDMLERLPRGGEGASRLQMLMFSATLHSNAVQAMAEVACEDPTWVDLKGPNPIPDTVHHAQLVLDGSVDESNCADLPTDNIHTFDEVVGEGAEAKSLAAKRMKLEMCEKVIRVKGISRALIFCRTNFDCENLERHLNNSQNADSNLKIAVLGSARSQEERRRNLESFKNASVNILICTDVAVRGIDVSGVPYLINLSLPDSSEDYIHRVGRIGRADRFGLALSIVSSNQEKVWFCRKGTKPWLSPTKKDTLSVKNGGKAIWRDEMELMGNIERRLGAEVPRMDKSLALPEELEEANYGASKNDKGARRMSQATSMHLQALDKRAKRVASLESQAQGRYLQLCCQDQQV